MPHAVKLFRSIFMWLLLLLHFPFELTRKRGRERTGNRRQPDDDPNSIFSTTCLHSFSVLIAFVVFFCTFVVGAKQYAFTLTRNANETTAFMLPIVFVIFNLLYPRTSSSILHFMCRRETIPFKVKFSDSRHQNKATTKNSAKKCFKEYVLKWY